MKLRITGPDGQTTVIEGRPPVKASVNGWDYEALVDSVPTGRPVESFGYHVSKRGGVNLTQKAVSHLDVTPGDRVTVDCYAGALVVRRGGNDA